MCLSPIRIPNKYYYTRCHDTEIGKVTLLPNGRKYIYVPCGKCKQCLQAKRDALYLRVRNEYIANGKRGIFHTLTYEPSKRPTALYSIPCDISYIDNEVKKRVYSDKEYPVYFEDERDTLILDEGYNTFVSCWDKKHVQTYLKSLNDKVLYDLGKRKGITRLHKGKLTPEWRAFLANTPRPLKYIVTCERGKSDLYRTKSGRTRFGQQCPHYHVILLPQLPEEDLPLAYLEDLSVKMWSYGLSYPLVIKNKEGYKRSPYQAIQYVTKYITKSDGFAFKHTFTHNGNRVTKYLNPEDLTFNNHSERLRKCPFVLLSHGMGIAWLHSVDTEYLINTLLKEGVKDMGSNGKTRSINIPAYYLNKLRYQSVKKTNVIAYEPNNKTRKVVPSLEGMTSFCKYEEIWDFTDGFPRFVGYDVLLPSASLRVNAPTPLHDKMQRQLTHLKASFYADSLYLYQLDKQRVEEAFSSSHKLVKLCPQYETLHDLLNSVTPDDMYTHLVNDYYRGVNERYDTIVDLISVINQYFSEKSIIKREIDYKAHLRKSIESKPEIFDVNPFIYA